MFPERCRSRMQNRRHQISLSTVSAWMKDLFHSTLLCLTSPSVTADFSLWGWWRTGTHCPEGLVPDGFTTFSYILQISSVTIISFVRKIHYADSAYYAWVKYQIYITPWLLYMLVYHWQDNFARTNAEFYEIRNKDYV